MNNFECIAEKINIDTILAEIDHEERAWEEHQGRQQTALPQRETQSIPIRGLRSSRIRGRRRRDVHESRYTSGSSHYPAIIAFLEDFASRNDGKLGRAKLARLAPSGRVYPHLDRGAYYYGRDRYHLVLRSASGSPLTAGDESIRMHERELWWFDNQRVHEARNDSQQERLHLIFDFEPRNTRLLRRHRSPIYQVAGDLGVALAAADAAATVLGHGEGKPTLRTEGELVDRCVRLYLCGCGVPKRWASALDQRGVAEMADERPLRALARAVLATRESQKVQRLARTIGWALAEIDGGDLAPPGVVDAVVERGGMKAISRMWPAGQRESAEPTG